MKYGQQIINVNPEFQKQINYFLNKGNLGYQITVDGKWGPKTTKALQDINSKLLHNELNLNNSSETIKDLDIAYSNYTRGDQGLNKWKTISQTSKAMQSIKQIADKITQNGSLKDTGLIIMHSHTNMGGPSEDNLTKIYANNPRTDITNNVIQHFGNLFEQLDKELNDNGIHILPWSVLYQKPGR